MKSNRLIFLIVSILIAFIGLFLSLYLSKRSKQKDFDIRFELKEWMYGSIIIIVLGLIFFIKIYFSETLEPQKQLNNNFKITNINSGYKFESGYWVPTVFFKVDKNTNRSLIKVKTIFYDNNNTVISKTINSFESYFGRYKPFLVKANKKYKSMPVYIKVKIFINTELVQEFSINNDSLPTTAHQSKPQ